MATMTAEEAAEWGKTLSFEKVWAALMENREQQKKDEQLLRETRKAMAEAQAETQKAMAEAQAETRKAMAEAQAETQKAMAETQRAMAEAQKTMAEAQAETQKVIAEAQAEAQKAMAETQAEIAKTQAVVAETSRKVDKVAGNVGGLNRSMGDLIETLVAARLWEKFSGYPYNLKRAYRRVPLFDENNLIKTDIDILLSDTEWAMAVEVKRELSKEDEVDRHVKRMALIRKYPPAETAGKRLLGALAGGEVHADAKNYAHKRGLFVLELTGESVSLTEPPEGFAPQEW